MNRKKHAWSGLTLSLNYIVILVVLAIFLFPIYWMVVTSFKNQIDVFTTNPTFFFTATTANYKVLFEDGFLGYIGTSLIICLISTLLCIVLGCGIAYPFARYKLKGAKDIMTWILTLRIVPPIVSALPVYLLFANLNMIDSYFSLIVMYTFMNLPLATWLLFGFFQDIPGELEESGLVDGASRITAFFRIILPLIGPGLVAAGILCFIFAWNEFLFANVLTGANVRTATVGLNVYSTGTTIKWGVISAAGTIILIPVFIITMIVQKHMVRGLTLGAVKG